jgi:hypothetical protein
MKAYDSNQVWVCSECGLELDVINDGPIYHFEYKTIVEETSDGETPRAIPITCSNAGKYFKLPMVELEEVE